MSMLERFEQAEDKRAFIELEDSPLWQNYVPLIQHFFETKNEELLTVLLNKKVRDGWLAGKTQVTVTLSFIEMIKTSNNFWMLSQVSKFDIDMKDPEVNGLIFRWFVETRDTRILTILRNKGNRPWLYSQTREIVNYAIEWNDNKLLNVCSDILPLRVPALELMIERIPRHLELLLTGWLARYDSKVPIDILDCLIAKYEGSNKIKVMASICFLTIFNVDVVRRVADNYPEALSCFQDWSVRPGCRQVCDLFMFNALGHKLRPTRLIRSDPEYLRDYQKEIRLAEFVNLLHDQDAGILQGRGIQQYRVCKYLKLHQMARLEINIGNLISKLKYFRPKHPRGEPNGDRDVAETIAAFNEYIESQSPEYRQDFRASLAIHRDMAAGDDGLPAWADI